MQNEPLRIYAFSAKVLELDKMGERKTALLP